MKLFPKFLVKLTDRALLKVPARYRAAARYAVALAAIGLLAFEASRFWIMGRDVIAPKASEGLALYNEMAGAGNWLGLLLALVFFTIPFGLFALGLRAVARRLTS